MNHPRNPKIYIFYPRSYNQVVWIRNAKLCCLKSSTTWSWTCVPCHPFPSSSSRGGCGLLKEMSQRLILCGVDTHRWVIFVSFSPCECKTSWGPRGGCGGCCGSCVRITTRDLQIVWISEQVAVSNVTESSEKGAERKFWFFDPNRKSIRRFSKSVSSAFISSPSTQRTKV